MLEPKTRYDMSRHGCTEQQVVKVLALMADSPRIEASAQFSIHASAIRYCRIRVKRPSGWTPPYPDPVPPIRVNGNVKELVNEVEREIERIAFGTVTFFVNRVDDSLSIGVESEETERLS